MELTRKDIRKMAQGMAHNEVRYLVDTYYEIQEYRKSTDNRERAADEGLDDQPKFISMMFDGLSELEKYTKRAMDEYVKRFPLSMWARSIKGIGPVLAAGLIAHIDIKKAKTPGNIYSFAGLDPSRKWLSRDEVRKIMYDFDVNPSGKKKVSMKRPRKVARAVEKAGGIHASTAIMLAKKKSTFNGKAVYGGVAMRPYNAGLKVLCWKIGRSFKFQSGRDNPGLYGRLYNERKEHEVKMNDMGENEEQAQEVLEKCPHHEQRNIYKEGLLPKGHLDMRARRWVVKLFLSHYWEVGRKLEGLSCPDPYPIAHLGHAKNIEPPNIDKFVA